MNKVYMGWDPRESGAYSVASFSIMRRTSKPVIVEPLMWHSLAHEKILTRPIERRGAQLWCPISDAPMSTEFAISRFAVPILHKEGWALFADCDMLFVDDIEKLFALADNKYAVMVCKHDYAPREEIKMDGQAQAQYARKNWSSLILWNCSHPANRKLESIINTWTGLPLHQFRWLEDDQIGELPLEWNWLVNVYDNKPDVSNLHFTLGGPWFSHYPPSPYDDLWKTERDIQDAWVKRSGKR